MKRLKALKEDRILNSIAELKAAANACGWSREQLQAIYNAIPGAPPKKRLRNRPTAIEAIWKALPVYDGNSESSKGVRRKRPMVYMSGGTPEGYLKVTPKPNKGARPSKNVIVGRLSDQQVRDPNAKKGILNGFTEAVNDGVLNMPKVKPENGLKPSWDDRLKDLIELHFNAGQQFTSADVKEFGPYFAAHFPTNTAIAAGLRRTLQHLRDQGFIEFTGRGEYRRV